jgi:uncharacterized protein (TIGR00369 family)
MSGDSGTAGSDIPAGYTLLHLQGGFVAANGPLYGRFTDGRLHLGLRIGERHSNAFGVCHGGMLSMFADIQIALAIVVQDGVRAFLPTINLVCDFLAPALVGTWLSGETEVLRTTRNLTFGQAVLTADGTPVVRASGVFKRPSREDPRFDLATLLPGAGSRQGH